MKVTVRPLLTVTDGKDVSAAVQCRFAHNDNSITIRAADTMVKDGASMNGLSVGVAAGDRFDLVFDGAGDNPRLRVNSHVLVGDGKRVDLVYRHAIAGGANSVECKYAVDDANRVSVLYDLSDYAGIDYKRATVKLTHVQGDFEISPSFNAGSEQVALGVKYNVDAENSLNANYNVATKDASIQWTNNSGLGGDGSLRITARANAGDTKAVPTLLLEKNFDLDV